MNDASTSPAWAALATESRRLTQCAVADLFAADPQRVERLTVEGAGLVLDLTRQRVDARVLDLLSQLADDLQLRARIEGEIRRA